MRKGSTEKTEVVASEREGKEKPKEVESCERRREGREISDRESTVRER